MGESSSPRNFATRQGEDEISSNESLIPIFMGSPRYLTTPTHSKNGACGEDIVATRLSPWTMAATGESNV